MMSKDWYPPFSLWRILFYFISRCILLSLRSRVMAKNIFNKKVSSIVIMEDTDLSTSLFEFFSYFIMVISGNQ